MAVLADVLTVSRRTNTIAIELLQGKFRKR